MTRSSIKDGAQLFASEVCMGLRQTLKRRALRATEEQHQTGAYGNMIHDAETLKRAAKILDREAQRSQ